MSLHVYPLRAHVRAKVLDVDSQFIDDRRSHCGCHHAQLELHITEGGVLSSLSRAYSYE